MLHQVLFTSVNHDVPGCFIVHLIALLFMVLLLLSVVTQSQYYHGPTYDNCIDRDQRLIIVGIKPYSQLSSNTISKRNKKKYFLLDLASNGDGCARIIQLIIVDAWTLIRFYTRALITHSVEECVMRNCVCVETCRMLN